MKLTFALVTSFLVATTAAMPFEERDNHVDWYQDPSGEVAKLFLRPGGKPGKPLQTPEFGSDGESSSSRLIPRLTSPQHGRPSILPRTRFPTYPPFRLPGSHA